VDFSAAHTEVTDAIRAGAWGPPESTAGPAPQARAQAQPDPQPPSHYGAQQAQQARAMRAVPASAGQLTPGQTYRILDTGAQQQAIWNQVWRDREGRRAVRNSIVPHHKIALPDEKAPPSTRKYHPPSFRMHRRHTSAIRVCRSPGLYFRHSSIRLSVRRDTRRSSGTPRPAGSRWSRCGRRTRSASRASGRAKTGEAAPLLDHLLRTIGDILGRF
jgi:hypothetical protein